MTAAETLKVVYGLVQEISKENLLLSSPASIADRRFLVDGKASGDSVWETLGKWLVVTG
jgi:hypothetical protein